MAEVPYSAAMAARYDRDFQAIFGGSDRGDLDFFVATARGTNGPIAEIGAGTGRVIRAVAAACPGRACVGVEPSPDMRAAFARAGDAAVVMHAGSFTTIPLADRSQGFVFAAFRSFQHVLDPDAQLAALREMKRVAMPGATVAIDLFDPDYTRLASTGWARAAAYVADGRHVERWERRRVERARQIITVDFAWHERERMRVVAIERASYRVRYTFAAELAHLLARVGFDAIDIRGDYDGRPIGDEPRELVVTATVSSASHNRRL